MVMYGSVVCIGSSAAELGKLEMLTAHSSEGQVLWYNGLSCCLGYLHLLFKFSFQLLATPLPT